MSGDLVQNLKRAGEQVLGAKGLTGNDHVRLSALLKVAALEIEALRAGAGAASDDAAELRAALAKMIDQVGYRTLDWAGTVCAGCGADQPNGEHWDDCAVLEAEAALAATEGGE